MRCIGDELKHKSASVQQVWPTTLCKNKKLTHSSLSGDTCTLPACRWRSGRRCPSPVERRRPGVAGAGLLHSSSLQALAIYEYPDRIAGFRFRSRFSCQAGRTLMRRTSREKGADGSLSPVRNSRRMAKWWTWPGSSRGRSGASGRNSLKGSRTLVKSPLGVLWNLWEYVPCSARPVPSSAPNSTGWAVLLTTQLQAQMLLYLMLLQPMQQCTGRFGHSLLQHSMRKQRSNPPGWAAAIPGPWACAAARMLGASPGAD